MYNGTCCIAGIFLCETYKYVKSIYFMEQFRTSVGGLECGCTLYSSSAAGFRFN